MPRFLIVNTDNFDGDYPDEKFVENLPRLDDRAYAERIAEAINNGFGGSGMQPRFFKVVEEGYVLRPGFEP